MKEYSNSMPVYDLEMEGHCAVTFGTESAQSLFMSPGTQSSLHQ